MLNRLFIKRNKDTKKISPMHNFKYNTAQIYSIKAEKSIEVNAMKVAKVIDRSINYRPLEIKSKRLNKKTEESKSILYRDTIPQYNVIKKLVENNRENMTIDKIDYKKLDNKIKQLEEKRNYNIDLLELDLYSAYIDEFYILKSYMDRE